ncbi:MAG: YbaN family protein [Candidatus Thiodiazotropha sp.]
MDANKSENVTGEPRNSAVRGGLMALGWLLFALGLIGIFLPVLPTTVFWIGAVWCWSRSAPHLTRRILAHPHFGEPVRLFLEQGKMSRQGKGWAFAGMTLGFFLLQWLGQPGIWLSTGMGLVLVLVAVWLWRRPEPLSDSPEYLRAGSETDIAD